MAFLTNTFQIEADIKQKKHIGKPVITANDTSTFIVSVQDNGVPMNMSKVTKAVLVNLCPDRQVFETVGVIQGDDKVVFDLPTEATEVAGTVRATVQLHGNDERVSTISFNYEVAKDLRMLHNPTVREKMLIEVALQDGPLYIEQAKVAAEKAEKVATENKTRWLPAVETVALRNSTYPNPAHGDTVRVNTEATIYRFQTGTGWIKTDQFSPTAIDQVTAQLAETVSFTESKIIESKTDIFSRRTDASIKKAIVFIDDDARLETYTRFKRIADEKGVKFSFCVITDFAGRRAEYMTWEQIQQMHLEGFDVLSHTHQHHDLSAMNEAQLEYALGESKRILNAKGYKAEHVVYPGGSYSKLSNDIARKYYKSGVAINSGINAMPIDNYVVTRPDLDKSSLASLKGLVDSLANRETGILVFMMHTFNEYWTTQKEQDLRDLIDYINLKTLPILTWSEAFNHFGNVVEIGSKAEGKYFKVDPYGNMHNQNYDNVASKRYARNSLSFNTTPRSFGNNEVSITDFNGSAVESGMPEKKEGTLVTYSGNDTKWQYWYPFSSNNIYARRSHNTADSWLAFKLVNTPYYSKVLDFGIVPAHSTKDMEFTITGVTFGKTLINANTDGALPAGLMMNATIKASGAIIVRLANVTASPITSPSTQSFKFAFSELQ